MKFATLNDSSRARRFCSLAQFPSFGGVPAGRGGGSMARNRIGLTDALERPYLMSPFLRLEALRDVDLHGVAGLLYDVETGFQDCLLYFFLEHSSRNRAVNLV